MKDLLKLKPRLTVFMQSNKAS